MQPFRRLYNHVAGQWNQRDGVSGLAANLGGMLNKPRLLIGLDKLNRALAQLGMGEEEDIAQSLV
jgi:hypothetical protein